MLIKNIYNIRYTNNKKNIRWENKINRKYK